jgi:hypothetical protein
MYYSTIRRKGAEIEYFSQRQAGSLSYIAPRSVVVMIRVHLKAPSRTDRDETTAWCRIGFQPVSGLKCSMSSRFQAGAAAFTSICV